MVRLGGVLLATGVALRPASGQLVGSAATTVASRYVWRGLTLVSGWVAQPGAHVGFRRGEAWAVGAGCWGDIELGGAEPTALTQRGTGRPGLGELDVEVSAASTVGSLALSIGWIRYTFHGDSAGGGLGSGANRSELRLSADWLGPTVSPSAGLFCALRRGGCYLETGAALPVIATEEARPLATVALLPEAGWSLGADRGPEPAFAGDGLTHLDLPLLVQIQLSGRTLEPALVLEGHLQWSQDPATRVGDRLGGTARVRAWIEIGVAASLGARGGRRR